MKDMVVAFVIALGLLIGILYAAPAISQEMDRETQLYHDFGVLYNMGDACGFGDDWVIAFMSKYPNPDIEAVRKGQATARDIWSAAEDKKALCLQFYDIWLYTAESFFE